MGQNVKARTRTFRANAALARFTRVKRVATPGGGDANAVYVDAADASDVSVGYLDREAFAQGDVVPVLLHSAEGTFNVIAAGAVTVGQTVAADDSGKSDVGAAGATQGTALSAAGADGDVIEVAPGL